MQKQTNKQTDARRRLLTSCVLSLFVASSTHAKQKFHAGTMIASLRERLGLVVDSIVCLFACLSGKRLT